MRLKNNFLSIFFFTLLTLFLFLAVNAEACTPSRNTTWVTTNYCPGYFNCPNCAGYSVGWLEWCGALTSGDAGCSTHRNSYTCPDGSTIYSGEFCACSTVSDDPSCGNPLLKCVHATSVGGACPSGGGEQTSCQVQNPFITYGGNNYVCLGGGGADVQIPVGQSFNLNYAFWGTGPTNWPYEVRSGWRGPWGTSPDTQLWCDYDDNFTEGIWHSETKTVSCPATAGTYDFVVRCYGAPNISSSNCNNFNDSEGCRVQCVTGPVSLGHVRIFHPILGILKLNLIPAADAIARGRGTIKFARFDGDKGTALDLVPVNDPNRSPVHIYTGRGGGNGIWSWALLR